MGERQAGWVRTGFRRVGAQGGSPAPAFPSTAINILSADDTHIPLVGLDGANDGDYEINFLLKGGSLPLGDVTLVPDNISSLQAVGASVQPGDTTVDCQEGGSWLIYRNAFNADFISGRILVTSKPQGVAYPFTNIEMEFRTLARGSSRFVMFGSGNAAMSGNLTSFDLVASSIAAGSWAKITRKGFSA